MYDRILIPTDGSDAATTAARAAIELARWFDADLHAIYVVELEPFPVVFDDAMSELARHGNETLDTIADWAYDANVETTTTVVENGEPVHEAIIDYTDDHDIDLTVMGTHGRTGVGRVLLGSVAEQTLRKSSVPVMTVHSETIVDSTFDSILVPFDGSKGSHGALDHALDLAHETSATLHFINVVDHAVVAGGDYNAGMVLDALKQSGEQALESVVERVEEVGVDVGEASVVVGSPFREIVDYADEADVDCIVMGTRGRSGINRVLLGSVTERVIRKTNVPVIATKAKTESE